MFKTFVRYLTSIVNCINDKRKKSFFSLNVAQMSLSFYMYTHAIEVKVLFHPASRIRWGGGANLRRDQNPIVAPPPASFIRLRLFQQKKKLHRLHDDLSLLLLLSFFTKINTIFPPFPFALCIVYTACSHLPAGPYGRNGLSFLFMGKSITGVLFPFLPLFFYVVDGSRDRCKWAMVCPRWWDRRRTHITSTIIIIIITLLPWLLRLVALPWRLQVLQELVLRLPEAELMHLALHYLSPTWASLSQSRN